MRKKAALDEQVPFLIDTDIDSKEFRKSLKPPDSEGLQPQTRLSVLNVTER